MIKLSDRIKEWQKKSKSAGNNRRGETQLRLSRQSVLPSDIRGMAAGVGRS